MEERLYLFEVLIDSIYFDDCVSEIPQKKQIVVSVKLGNIVTLEIRSETLPNRGEGGNKRIVDFKSGRSYLAPLLQEELLQALDTQGLEVTVGVRGDVVPLGTSSAPWDDCFKEMVQASHEEFVTPVSINDDFCLIENGVIKGNVQMFLRLSCFGKNIQTHVEVLQEGGNRQFLFKSPNMATTFICSKYGAGTSTDFLPVGALYNAGNIHKGAASGTNKAASWTAMVDQQTSFFEKRSSVQSECLFPEYLNIVPPVKDSAITFDIVSLRARPEEEKFLDFLTGKKFGDITDSIHSFSIADLKKLGRAIQQQYKYGNKNIQDNKHLFEIRTPLRLRGGGSPEGTPVRSARLRAGAPSKSPMAECREVMEQFDKILAEYKKALSPCGEIACNYNQNVTEDLCKKSCGIKPEMGTNTAGCGLPECQYAKYKSALMAMDADIEKQFIGPAILGNCGHPKCSYMAEPVLPPIHWDCPDPLPVGKCKNPNCPYGSNELKSQARFSSTKGPCGSDQCPYAPPAPCISPNCPFKNPPPCLPLKQAASGKTDGSKPKGNDTCSGCPFANPPQIVNMMFCDNPNCEALNAAASAGDCGRRDKVCESPNCPYRDLQNECSNPNCPLLMNEKSSEVCNNPNCPFAKMSTQSPMQSCSNPNCPFAGSSTDASSGSKSSSLSSACLNPDCPFRSTGKDKKEPPKETCANPECPFNVPSVESCKNPECPFKNKGSEESTESCDNPECPFKKGSKISAESEESECVCDNPTCPSKKDTCINPNCPFNLRGYGICTNPDCPHKKDAMGRDLGFCATPDPSFNEFCADKTCPYHDKKLDVAEAEAGKDEPKRLDPNAHGISMMRIGSKEVMVEEGVVERTMGDRPSVYDMAPCTIKTCKFMGGHLPCVDCGVGTEGKKRGPCPKTCPGDPICPLATARKSKRPPRRKDPLYKRICATKKKKIEDYGDMKYPGFKIGHRECVLPYFYVPPRMGWLWNIHTPCLSLKPRRGWRPGAITKTVARAILKHKRANSSNPQEEKKVKRRKNDDDSENELICPKPTLEIKKREGIYHITMNPLKDPNTLQMNENPYLDCTPMQFKVAKNNLLDPNCVCTDEGELYKSDSSSDDELDIQVTTPAGIIHPDRSNQKKEVKVKQTQYSEKDIPPPPEKLKEAKDGEKGKSKEGGKGGKDKKDKGKKGKK
ncbi:uncharacterized protein LOC123684295 isoform X2 [Harmonia axyridis]|uniref:uncharacterized protein LOC123684295 isoform X2 n=1 Tax=Harmonia axyridis TaxID=115357 RepID=UPI001E275BF5|nr:uncharacterized protein LOC123684295 isoform X2 [Harmonia axyridis]